MKRFVRLAFFGFLAACTVAVPQAAGAHFASVKKTAAVDSGEFSAKDLSEVDRLYAQLQAEYGYRPAIDPLAGFAEGAPALTPEAAALALRSARSATARLTSEIGSLETLYSNRDSGARSASDFEKTLFETLTRIESLAREIRNDVYIEILGKLEGKMSEAGSPTLQGLQLILQMRRLAEEMERGIESYGLSHSVQVVSVQELRRPSLNSIAGAIEQLTRDLRADRGAFQAAE